MSYINTNSNARVRESWRLEMLFVSEASDVRMQNSRYGVHEVETGRFSRYSHFFVRTAVFVKYGYGL